MTPTDKDIKAAALARLLQDRTSYMHEVEEKEAHYKILKEQDGKDEVASSDPNTAIILQETKDLIPLVEAKIKEVADDIRTVVSGEPDDMISRLLSDADQISENN